MLRYSEETINILVRDALNFEKNKRFSEAIEIYEELALQGVEFAIDRIPIAKHRFDNHKLRRIELFTNIISACAIGLSIVSISYNIGVNLISHTDINSYFTFNKEESQISAPLQPNVIYHSIKENPNNEQFEFEIFIPSKITRSELSKRILEAIEAYLPQSHFNEDNLKIDLKTAQNSTSKWIGYIDFDLKNKSECNVYILKDSL